MSLSSDNNIIVTAANNSYEEKPDNIPLVDIILGIMAAKMIPPRIRERF